jgi:hypothetical protein
MMNFTPCFQLIGIASARCGLLTCKALALWFWRASIHDAFEMEIFDFLRPRIVLPGATGAWRRTISRIFNVIGEQDVAVENITMEIQQIGLNVRHPAESTPETITCFFRSCSTDKRLLRRPEGRQMFGR